MCVDAASSCYVEALLGIEINSHKLFNTKCYCNHTVEQLALDSQRACNVIVYYDVAGIFFFNIAELELAF